jgi:riboflavin kinase / FMN adenylyltransferase
VSPAARGAVRVTALSAAAPRARRVAVGVFDGIHLGHREVIRGADTVLTFAPHPLAVVAPDRAPMLLTTVERRAELAGALGVREVVVIPMDRAMAACPAERFVGDVLVGALGATHVSVGENFRFGFRAKGDPAMLSADERFTTRVVPLLEAGGEIVCSTAVRDLVAAGRVEAAAALLGAPFAVPATVARCDDDGGRLAVTTPQGHLTPAPGRYACRAGADAAVVTVHRTATPGAPGTMSLVMGGPALADRRGRLEIAFLARTREPADGAAQRGAGAPRLQRTRVAVGA